MRLIDADKLIEKLNKNSIFRTVTNAEDKNAIEIIEEQPTSFDVDKVVEQLEELKDKALKRREELIELNSYNNIILKNIEYERGREYAFDDAIDIVKAGEDNE